MTLSNYSRKQFYGLMIGCLLATSPEKAQAEMEEVVVTGVAVVVSFWFPVFDLQ